MNLNETSVISREVASQSDFIPRKLPKISIKSLTIENYKAFDKHTFYFNNPKSNFVCFIGNNGSGKSTLLEIIQLLFTKFEGYNKQRILELLTKSIRTKDGVKKTIFDNDNFLIRAVFKTNLKGLKEYEVVLDKNGFIADHPLEIKEYIYRLCYLTRFDQELNTFQLHESKWSKFKKLFETVTGFKIKRDYPIFKEESVFEKQVFSFEIHKPNEIISYKDCSAGERKIIKAFSTLLNLEYTPRIILIDNVEMHVETNRHLDMIQALKDCFPRSQIFATTHSYRIARNSQQKEELYDLRVLNNKTIKKDPWRLYLIDEINDMLAKLNSITKYDHHLIKKQRDRGRQLLEVLYNVVPLTQEGANIKDVTQCKFFQDYLIFCSEVNQLFVKNIMKEKIGMDKYE